MMYDQDIWDELKEQYELSIMLYEGVLGWAKVIDGDLQDIQTYFSTTLELLNKIVTNISDAPDRLQQTVKQMEKVRDSPHQEITIDKLKQHLKILTTFRDQTMKLTTIGRQIKKGEEGAYLTEISQQLYKMAEAMSDTSTNLKSVLIKYKN